MRTVSRSVVLCALLLPFAAMAFGKKKVVEPSASGCVENMSVSGSFSSGKTFVVSTDHEGVPYSVVFRKTLAEVNRGPDLMNVNGNERTGYISAENGVKGGGGSTVPLRVMVMRQPDNSVRVEARFSIKGGQMTSEKKVAEGMCKIADAGSIDEAPAAEPSTES